MPPRSVTELTSALAAGHPIEFLFFWGHRPSPNGIGKGCLSQWWPAPFTVGGHTFATAEHYMMWRKALLFDNEDISTKILAATDPKQVKALGRKVSGFDQAAWESARYDIVVAGNEHKFGQHPDLREYLRSTGDQLLVEASPEDRVWGIGMTANDPRAQDPTKWRGQNLLGFALGDVRNTLPTDA